MISLEGDPLTIAIHGLVDMLVEHGLAERGAVQDLRTSLAGDIDAAIRAEARASIDQTAGKVIRDPVKVEARGLSKLLAFVDLGDSLLAADGQVRSRVRGLVRARFAGWNDAITAALEEVVNQAALRIGVVVNEMFPGDQPVEEIDDAGGA
jgi:hypothetical protein